MSWVLSAFADEAGGSTDEQIAALRRAGIKHVDLRGVDGFNITTLPTEKARQVRQKLDSAGITVAMFGSPIGKIDLADEVKIDLDKLANLARVGDILGCRSVRIFSYYNQKAKLDPQRRQAETLDRLKALRDLAAKLNLVLYHENEVAIFGEGCAQVQVLAAALRDGKTFRLIFDFDNYHQAGDDVWANWEKLGDLTDAFHLKDSDAAKQHVLVGEGLGQVRRVLTNALARNWSGPLAIEPHLQHSQAVQATGPSGKPNAQFAQMSGSDSFHLACQAARKLLEEIKAPVV
jgi:sugar phosphate isomerase/epimerase